MLKSGAACPHSGVFVGGRIDPAGRFATPGFPVLGFRPGGNCGDFGDLGAIGGAKAPRSPKSRHKPAKLPKNRCQRLISAGSGSGHASRMPR